jgi:glucose/mannose-6-phosphate isomerase
MNHNAIAGIERPEALITRSFVLFLNSGLYHLRNAARMQWTHAHFMQSGYNCDAVAAVGRGRLAQMLSVLHYGDYVSYYLAIANGVDPTPIEVLLRLKAHMAQT